MEGKTQWKSRTTIKKEMAKQRNIQYIELQKKNRAIQEEENIASKLLGINRKENKNERFEQRVQQERRRLHELDI